MLNFSAQRILKKVFYFHYDPAFLKECAELLIYASTVCTTTRSPL